MAFNSDRLRYVSVGLWKYRTQDDAIGVNTAGYFSQRGSPLKIGDVIERTTVTNIDQPLAETVVGYGRHIVTGRTEGSTVAIDVQNVPLLQDAGDRLSGAPPSRLISFGDSLSVASTNFGASSAANMYLNKFAAYLGLGAAGAPNAANFVEAAISGASSQRYINVNNRNLSLASSDLICGLAMFNTMRTLGPDPAFLQDLALQVEATLAWFALPESTKVRAILAGTTTVNPALALAGSWAYFAATVGTDLNQLVLRSASGTSTATFPAVTGDTVYIWFGRSTLAEAFTVSVDGVSYNVGGAVSYNTWLDAGIDWELCLLRVNGLADGAHTVVAMRGSGVANIIAVAGFDSQTIRSSCPAVLVGNCPTMISGTASQGYAQAGGILNDPLQALQTSSAGTLTGTINIPHDLGHAGVETYNRFVQRAVRNLQADGLRIEMIDVCSLLMPSLDVAGDFVHFNDGGNEKLFRAFRRVARSAYGL